MLFAENDAPEQQAEYCNDGAEARRHSQLQGVAHGAHQRHHQLYAGSAPQKQDQERVYW